MTRDLSSRRLSASLPMYPAAGGETLERFWRGVAGHLRERGFVDAPETLHSPGDDLLAHWLDPHLLLSQSCGYPYVTRLRRQGVQVVGAFRYDTPGCTGARYRSLLVCRDDDAARGLGDFRGRVAVVNGIDSHSGCNALRGALADLGSAEVSDKAFFTRVHVSGSHSASLQWVRDGRADLAAIDCVSLASLQRYAPGAFQGLRAFGETRDAPGLPLITSATLAADDLGRLRGALADAVVDPALRETCERLLIAGFEAVAPQAYDEIARIEQYARARGIVFPGAVTAPD